MPDDKKTCVNCRHFNTDYTGPVCAHPVAQTDDPIYGNNYSKSCYLMRSDGQACGPNASLFNKG